MCIIMNNSLKDTCLQDCLTLLTIKTFIYDAHVTNTSLFVGQM